MNLSERKIEQEMKRMREMGKIDGLIGAHNVGRIIDLHNQLNDKKKEDKFVKEMNARNKYFVKMIVYAIKNGSKAKYKSDSILISKTIN